MDDAQLVALVLADLSRIVDRTRDAYLERFPDVRRLPPERLQAMLSATRRTMEHFCRYYVEGTLDSDSWKRIRDLTVERAGETFSAEAILEIMDVARSVGVAAIRDLTIAHPELTDDDRAAVARVIDRFVTEIAEQEDQLRPALPPQRWDSVLAELEGEGADLR